MTNRQSGAGGAATAGGVSFQAMVSAWVAVHILAEEDAEAPFGLTGPLARIACEASGPIDDLVVTADNGCTAYVQAKRTVSLEKVRYRGKRLAPLPSALDQFVRQFLVSISEENASATQQDRFVLAAGTSAPRTIRVHLRQALNRVRAHLGQEWPPDGLNRAEQRALNVVEQHLQVSWRDATGSDPSASDVRNVLNRAHVAVIGVAEDESDERAAKTILRRSVLAEPSQAAAAWDVLNVETLRLIENRGHANRASLVNVLHGRGVNVRAARSYRGDIERLKEHSGRVIDRLAKHASIRLGNRELHIQRLSVQVLREAVEAGPTLVIGEAGVGKSGVLHSLSQTFLEEGRDVVVLAAEEFLTPGSLRNELGLDREVVEVLANWPGEQRAFLLFDALDAVRADASAATLRNLIGEVSEHASRWNILASVREYDARYSRDLAKVFEGAPPDGSVPSEEPFSRIRHVVVDRLTDEELQQIGTLGGSELLQLIESAPPEVVELLYNPFNLQLAAELLGKGTEPQAIRAVRSQLDLLDLYWQVRVLAGGLASASSREIVLRRAVQGMTEQRALHVDRNRVETEVPAGQEVRTLLSENVLVEWSPRPGAAPRRSTLAFAHHVLFDYAVARLFFPDSSSSFVELLARDPALVLLARPSLVMHFHQLWELGSDEDGREDFWTAVLDVCASSEIPEIGKLIGPGVAAEVGSTIRAFTPLLTALASDGVAGSAAASALHYALRVLVSTRTARLEDAALCCGLAERLSETLTVRSAYPVSWILWELVPRFDELSVPQTQQIGRAGRKLLEFAWARSPRDRHLVGRAIRFVCRTMATDVEASSALLRRAIETKHLKQHGPEELRWLGQHVSIISSHNPALVGEIYAAAFGHSETSRETTHMVGIVLPLKSNRRQDYEAGLYQLAQSFPTFLAEAPREAVGAMNAALESHVARRPLFQQGEREEPEEFDLNGVQAAILRDYSQVWDLGPTNRRSAIELLEDVEQRLQDLAERPEGAGELTHLLDALVRTCRLAVVWRRLLDLGARYPDRIGMKIRAAGWSLPVLMCSDTARSVGGLNGALFPDLGEAEREQIERAILSIPTVAPPERRSWAERRRDQLLGCLPNCGLVTAECRERLSALQAENAVPPNEDGVKMEFFSREARDVDFLTEAGVPVEEEPNRHLRELEAPVKAFAETHLNEAPEPQEFAEALPHMRRLHKALRSAEADGVHKEQADYAWARLAAACAAAARMEDLRCDEDAGVFVRTVLIDASSNDVPVAESDADERFVKAFWGGPAARIDAASGLMAILRHRSCADTDVIAAVEGLASDPVPAVRFQIASRLLARYERNPDWTWRLIERMATDRAPAVLQSLVDHTLRPLASAEPAKVVRLSLSMRHDARNVPERRTLVHSCNGVLALLFLWDKAAAASVVMDELLADVVDHVEEVGQLMRGFREILVSGPVDALDPAADAVRQRSWRFLLRATRGAAMALRRGVDGQDHATDTPRDRPSQEQMAQLASLLDSVGSNIYFVSGAYDRADSLSKPVLRRFYTESKEVIEELADVGLPSLAHHLLETLEILVPFDPRAVFLRVSRVVRGGRKGGYEYDNMAETVIVRIVDRYLADYRQLFRADEEMQRNLIGILDTFVHAGSEDALRLSYGLGAIFR